MPLGSFLGMPFFSRPVCIGNFHESAQAEIPIEQENNHALQCSGLGVEVFYVDEISFPADPNISCAEQALLLLVFDFGIVDRFGTVGEHGHQAFIPKKTAEANKQGKNNQGQTNSLNAQAAG